jgi:hypothetical protein
MGRGRMREKYMLLGKTEVTGELSELKQVQKYTQTSPYN